VTLDTTRADHIGVYGGEAVATPNLDAIAAEGTRFADAIATAPLTLPSHSSMFTGSYPFRHGVRHNGAYRLPPSSVTLAERLRDAGFRTGAFVGAFVLDASFGLEQGFETYSSVSSDAALADFARPAELQRPAAAVNASALRWFDSVAEERFFAWIHYYDPHHPYAPPEEPGRALQGTGYDREISYVDSCFGDVVAYLNARNLLDRTLLVVVGDHGESLGSHGEQTHGIFLYEPSLRVPFFARAPGLVPDGAVYNSPVSVADVAPTVLGLLELPALADVDGRSLFHGREDSDRLVYAETWMPRIEFGWQELAMVRGLRFKYIRAPQAELYDLDADREEASNLSDLDRDRAADLSERLDELLATGVDDVDAAHPLSADTLAKLQSLGYLDGGSLRRNAGSGDAALPDPKDRIAEAVELEASHHALEHGDLALALEGFDRVLLDNPQSHSALLGRARVLLRTGELAAAEETAERALAAAGSDPAAPQALADNARKLLASVLALSGHHEEAEVMLPRAPDDEAGPRSPVAALLAGAKNRDDARAIVDLAARRNPTDPWAWAGRIEYAVKVADSALFEEAVDRLAGLGPTAAPAFIDVAKHAQDRGDLPLALSLFEEAFRALPDHPDVVGYLGTARLAAGDLAGAVEAFEQVRTLRPEDPRVPLYLANIALLRDDEPEAKRLIDEALRIDPGFLPPLLNHARWLAERGRRAEAIEVAESALRRRPGDAQVEALLRELRAAVASNGG
jgi:arylsulfatase A-like enzyme/Tfp pilus assembly protein PilF